MQGYWMMKTYLPWAEVFKQNSEIGIDEDGVDDAFTSYSQSQVQAKLSNPRIQRRFNEFCKWANKGDYVVVGIGKQGVFQMTLVARITSDYEFDASHSLYRHFRQIEILREFDSPIPVSKWSQAQRIERIDENDFIDTLIRFL